MKLKTIYLLRTPLDSNYKNVIDYYMSSGGLSKKFHKNLYCDKIINTYQYHKIDIQNASGEFKSVNRKDDNLIVNLELSYDFVHEYNYMILIDNDDNYSCYFIIDYTELNSLFSVALLCKKDIWFEYSYEFFNSFYNKNCYTKTKHIDRYDIISDNKYIIKSSFLRTNEIEPISKTKTLADTDELGYQILYLKVAVDNEIQTFYEGGSDRGYTNGSKLPRGFSVVNYFYFPLKCYYRNTFTEIENYYFRDIFGTVVGGDLFISEYLSTHILYAQYTFYCPYPATMGTDNNGKTVIQFTAISEPIFPLEIDGSSVGVYGFLVKPYENTFQTFGTPKKEDYITNEPEVMTYNNNTIYRVFSDTSLYQSIEPAFYFYPWHYHIMKFGNTEIPLIFNTIDNDWAFRIEIYGEGVKVTPKIADDSQLIEQTDDVKFWVAPNGTLTTYKDSYAEFIRNQGAISESNYTTKTINTAINTVTKALIAGVGAYFAPTTLGASIGIATMAGAGITGFSTIVTDAVNYSALKEQAQSASDIYALSTNSALPDDCVQDRYLLYEVNGNITYEKKQLRYKLQFEGYNIETYSNVTDLSRMFFNYIKTVNFEIPTITNELDRKEFQNILNNGVTIWSFDSTEQIPEQYSSIKQQIYSFNKMVANYERGFYI